MRKRSVGVLEYNVLVINPGSTSTKIALFQNKDKIFEKKVIHSAESLRQYPAILAQFDFRYEEVLKAIEESGVSIQDLSAVVGRGGFLRPIPSGTYEVNDKMTEDLKASREQHASTLGALIAKKIADRINKKAYIVDPIVVDELEEIARVSGLNGVNRKSIFHALNHKAIARKTAAGLGKEYSECNLVIAHMGGGISVGAHQRGKIIDVNNALDGEGAFSPERSGNVPMGDVIRMCFSGEYTLQEMLGKITGNGGIVSYFGINDMREIEAKAEHKDEEACFYMEAMSYQIAKEIGAYATVLKGKVDAIALTGGLAFSEPITKSVTERVEFIAPIHIYPGEDEMEALAEGGLRILKEEEIAKEYRG